MTVMYTPLAEITLGSSSSATVTFTNIPSGFRDLAFVYNGETVNSGAYDIHVQPNNNTADTTVVTMYGTGSAAQSFFQGNAVTANYGSASRTQMVGNLMDYSQTNKHKSGLIRGSSTNGVGMHALRYASTNAVTSLVIRIGSGTFASGSTFALYGVK